MVAETIKRLHSGLPVWVSSWPGSPGGGVPFGVVDLSCSTPAVGDSVADILRNWALKVSGPMALPRRLPFNDAVKKAGSWPPDMWEVYRELIPVSEDVE